MTEPPKATKAQEVYEKVEQLVAGGMSRPDAFKQLAQESGLKVNSVRGAFYSGRPENQTDRPKRTKRRWTTTEDAVSDARRALEAAIESIDAELVAAETRATEAAAEHKAMAEAAPRRKEEIRARIEALT